MTMTEKFKGFVAAMEIVTDENGTCRRARTGHWWFAPEHLPGNDFNREIVEPGVNETYPEGALGVRVDDDFWTVAVFPLEFRDLSIETLVPIVWPKITDAEFRPDSGTPEQKEYYAERSRVMKVWEHIMDSIPRPRQARTHIDEIKKLSENVYETTIRECFEDRPRERGDVVETRVIDITTFKSREEEFRERWEAQGGPPQ